MIQRIQTVFLLLAIILLSFLFFTPFASFIIQPQMEKFLLDITGLVSEGQNPECVFSPWALIILSGLTMLITLVSIFMFRKRMLQIRLCIINIVLLVGLQGLLFYIAVSVGKQLSASPDYGFVFIFPIVTAILHFLAIRAIAKDEALIRSLNRLR